MHDMDLNTILNPRRGHLYAGVRVLLKTACKRHAYASTACDRCKGTGNWVNPSNARDVRSCFGCSGKGAHVDKVLDASGKPTWRRYAEGTRAEVIEVYEEYSRFRRYAPAHLKVRVKLEDGYVESWFVCDVRLDAEPDEA